MHNEVLSMMLVRQVHRPSQEFVATIYLTFSEVIGDELVYRIIGESWVGRVKRLDPLYRVCVRLNRSADLMEAGDALIRILKEWHQEKSIILDDYRPLKIMHYDKAVANEYFSPEEDLPEAQLLRVQIQKRIAALLDNYDEADNLRKLESELMAKFLLSSTLSVNPLMKKPPSA